MGIFASHTVPQIVLGLVGESSSRQEKFHKSLRNLPSFASIPPPPSPDSRGTRSFLSPAAGTISSPLNLNSRSIRPLGRFCSNGSEINVSFECCPVPRGSSTESFSVLNFRRQVSRIDSRLFVDRLRIHLLRRPRIEAKPFPFEIGKMELEIALIV